MTGAKATFYEFFAGGGMARAGLGPGWDCLFANDFDPMKAATYEANWGKGDMLCGDVAGLTTRDLPGYADLVWASFPCQDLSLAGDYAGIGGAQAFAKTRSGTFWPFWSLVKALKLEGRAPRLIVLENVYGALTSRGGRDFAAICRALSGAGYRFGAIVLDAIHFVPQSRPRVFFIAVRKNAHIPEALLADEPSRDWHPRALQSSQKRLSATAKERWIWWNIPVPLPRNTVLADLIEDEPTGVRWHSVEQTEYILSLMSPVNLAKLKAAKSAGRRMVGGVYRRTRPDAGNVKRQRAEVRFDDVAGCLRTPSGGSSRQTILVVDGELVRSRLLSPREAARLMGLEDQYKMPTRYNDAYHVAGDGLCVPAVRYIADTILEPIIAAQEIQNKLIAAE